MMERKMKNRKEKNRREKKKQLIKEVKKIKIQIRQHKRASAIGNVLLPSQS